MSEEFYEERAEEFFQSTVNVDLGPLYAPFLDRLPVGAKILDAGCGSGRDSLHFLRKGYDVTAFDASPSLAAMAEKHIGRKVLRLTFEELAFRGEFDGIWACASLLHVPLASMRDVFLKLQSALKPEGVLYASFKHGTGETSRDGRTFTSFDEDSFTAFIDECPGFSLAGLWRTTDRRAIKSPFGRADETWLNALVVTSDSRPSRTTHR